MYKTMCRCGMDASNTAGGTVRNICKTKLYLAFGIAGAIQHMTGIDADCIISINNNPRAAIFAYSDYGVVSDAKKLLESMLKQMEEGKEFL